MFQSFAVRATGMNGASITLRPIRGDDEAFLLNVYASTRLEERLGFSRIDDRGVYWFMKWAGQPEATQ